MKYLKVFTILAISIFLTAGFSFAEQVTIDESVWYDWWDGYLYGDVYDNDEPYWDAYYDFDPGYLDLDIYSDNWEGHWDIADNGYTSWEGVQVSDFINGPSNATIDSFATAPIDGGGEYLSSLTFTYEPPGTILLDDFDQGNLFLQQGTTEDWVLGNLDDPLNPWSYPTLEVNPANPYGYEFHFWETGGYAFYNVPISFGDNQFLEYSFYLELDEYDEFYYMLVDWEGNPLAFSYLFEGEYNDQIYEGTDSFEYDAEVMTDGDIYFLMYANNVYNPTSPGSFLGQSGGAIPEPATMVSLLLGGLGLAIKKKYC